MNFYLYYLEILLIITIFENLINEENILKLNISPMEIRTLKKIYINIYIYEVK